MFNFFKKLFIKTLSTIAYFVVIVLIIFLVHSILSRPPKLAENSILKIKLHGSIVERISSPIALSMLVNDMTSTINLWEITSAIKNAKHDAHIKGIYLEVGMLGAGWAQLSEIRQALLDFQKDGKFVVAYGEYYTNKTYYVATAANEIILHPEGHFLYNGLHMTVPFFKSALEKLDIKPQIFKCGEYKSAVEPFSCYQMSKENKAQYAELLSSIYATYTTAITTTRAITLRQLNEIADTLAVTTPQEAYNFKFVTSLGYYNDVETILKNKLNLAHEDALRYVRHYDYTMPKSRHHTPKQNIAVIIAEGDIVSGNSTETNIGSQDLAQTIRKLRKDKNVKAVVLRINSPGGSALASDVLWKELLLLKETKPVIASLSSVAASGGYYLAVACDKICAHPNTITGSIGVFAMFFEVHDLLKNKFGITTDTVKTNKYADCFENFGRTLDEHEKKMIHKNIEKTYSSFLNRISQGRNLSVPAVQKVASGRVWSGITAKDKKLVDAIGGLDEAIEMAASMANIAIGDVYVTYWPKPKRAWDRLAGKLKHISVSLLQSPQELVSSEILNFKKLLQMQDPQMRLTYDILID